MHTFSSRMTALALALLLLLGTLCQVLAESPAQAADDAGANVTAAEDDGIRAATSGVAQLFIALDTTNNIKKPYAAYNSAMALLKPLADFAQCHGTPVTLIDTSEKSGDKNNNNVKPTVFYPGVAQTAVQALSQIPYNEINLNSSTYYSQVAADLKDNQITPGSVGDLYVVSRLDRMPGSRNEEGGFTSNDAAAFYSAYSEMLLASPALNLHFIWFQQGSNDTPFVDTELEKAFPGRVSSCLISSGAERVAQIEQLLTQQFGADIVIPLSVTPTGPLAEPRGSSAVLLPYAYAFDTDAMLRLDFDETSPIPENILFMPASAVPELFVNPESDTDTENEATASDDESTPEADTEATDSAEMSPEKTPDTAADDAPTAQPDAETSEATPGEASEATPGEAAEAPEDSAGADASENPDENGEALESTAAADENAQGEDDGEAGPLSLMPVHIDPETHSAWLYLKDIALGEYDIVLEYAAGLFDKNDESDNAQPAAYTAPKVTAYLCDLQPEVTLTGNSTSAGEDTSSLVWNLDNQTLDVYASMPFIPQETLTPQLILTYSQKDKLAIGPDGVPEADAAETTTVFENFAIAESGVNGLYHWTCILPKEYLPRESEFKLRVEIIINPQSAAKPASNELLVRTENRPPVVVDKDDANIVSFFSVPGQKTETIQFNVHDHFFDPDGDVLTIEPVDWNGTINAIDYDCEYDRQTGVMTYTQKNQGSNEPPTREFKFKATDGRGGETTLTVTIDTHSLKYILESLRMTPDKDTETVHVQNVEPGVTTYTATGTIGKPNTVRYRLDASALEAYDKARKRYPSLPPIDELLTVSVDEPENAACKLELDEEGNLILTVELGESVKADSLNLTFTVAMPAAGADASANEDVVLANLVPALTVNIENQKPVLLIEHEQKQLVTPFYIEGMPGNYTPVAFEDLFGTVNPVTMFADNETHSADLTYCVKLEGPVEYPAALAITPDDAGWYIFSQNPQDALNLVFTGPDKATVTLRAYDQEHYSDEVVYHAQLKSRFMRQLLFVLISILIILIIAIIALLIYRRSMPTFADACLWIAYNHAQQTPQLNDQTASKLQLGSYAKDRVPLLTLMIASAQFLPESIPADVLADIELIPGKNSQFGIAVGNNAQAADVRVSCNNVEIGKQKKSTSAKFGSIVTVSAGTEHISLTVAKNG